MFCQQLRFGIITNIQRWSENDQKCMHGYVVENYYLQNTFYIITELIDQESILMVLKTV